MSRRALTRTLVLLMLAALTTDPAMAEPGTKDRSGHGQPQERHGGQDEGRGKGSEQREQDGNDRGKNSGQNQNYSNNRGNGAEQHSSLSPREAAERAQAQYGGQVLKVSREGNGYRVRLLRDDGRVITVTVGN